MAKKNEVEEKKVKNAKNAKKEVAKKVGEKKNIKDSKKVVKEEKKDVSSKKQPKVKEVKNEEVVTNVVVEEKKDNTKKKKIIKGIIYSLISLLIIGALIFSIIESSERSKYFKEVTMNEVNEMIKEDEINIVYWASPSCGYCEMFGPIVKEVSYEEKVEFNYLNTSKLDNDSYATMYTYFTAFDEIYNTKNLGTPSVILFKNGKIVNISVGALDKEGLVSFLKSENVIE